MGTSGPVMNVLVNTKIANIVRDSTTDMNVLRTLTSRKLIPLSFTMCVVFNRGVNAYIATLLSAVNAGAGSGHATIVRVLFGMVNAIIFIIVSVFLPFAG